LLVARSVEREPLTAIIVIIFFLCDARRLGTVRRAVSLVLAAIQRQAQRVEAELPQVVGTETFGIRLAHTLAPTPLPRKYEPNR